MQVSLFDVSDLRNPVRLSQQTLGENSWSEVENDHHAFLWWAPEHLAVIPAAVYDGDGGDQQFGGSVAFRVDRAGGIEPGTRLAHPFADGYAPAVPPRAGGRRPARARRRRRRRVGPAGRPRPEPVRALPRLSVRKFRIGSCVAAPMTRLRKLTISLAAACATLAVAAAPSMAVVGGQDASAGEYPSVAEITFGKSFLCTGTLIAPDYVLTAGHCGSITGAAVSSPAAWPAAAIDVRIGSVKPGQGELVPVQRVIVEPSYLVNPGYDITLLQLSRNSTKTPTHVAGAGAGALWSPGTLETIAGFGTTEEGGDTPDTLQEAHVPITTDAYCGGAYDDFDAQTMVCAGYPQGGTDTCQGDSGGPLFGRTGTGALKVVGATSFGEGCARPGKPGVYARVGDATLREWIRSQAPAGVD